MPAPRLRVPSHTRLTPRSLSQLASNTLINSRPSSRTSLRISPLTIQSQRGRTLTSSSHLQATKGAEGREEISTESTEYSKSGSDAQSAAQDEAAFEPGRTDPGQERRKAGENSDNNPLDASPANQEISKPKGAAEARPEGSGNQGGRERTSGGGSPGKAG